MSEREKDDGLLVGILVVLLLLVVGGVGLGGFTFVRAARVREMEARLAAERAMVAEERARAAEAAMRASAEAARAEAEAAPSASAVESNKAENAAPDGTRDPAPDRIE